MKVFGFSVSFLLFLFIAFVIGAKWGGGVVSKIPIIGAA